jgi:hypothetical protein
LTNPQARWRTRGIPDHAGRNWKFSQLILAPNPSEAHMVVVVHWLLACVRAMSGKCSYLIQKTGDGPWT